MCPYTESPRSPIHRLVVRILVTPLVSEYCQNPLYPPFADWLSEPYQNPLYPPFADWLPEPCQNPLYPTFTNWLSEFLVSIHNWSEFIVCYIHRLVIRTLSKSLGSPIQTDWLHYYWRQVAPFITKLLICRWQWGDCHLWISTNLESWSLMSH